MQLIFEFAPIFIFFIAFKVWGIYVATATAIGVTVFQVIVLRGLKKRVSPMLWVSLCIITVMGGATIFFHNETFIKAKPTVLYWLFGIVLLLGEVVWKKNILKAVSNRTLELPEKAWNFMNRSWMIFFFAVGILNIYVAMNYSTDVWVNFKLFGVMGGMFIIAIVQGIYITKNSISDDVSN